MLHNKKKVLLGLLPYWTPLIPPQGITYLKSALEKNGHSVYTIDANIESQFKSIYDRYFNTLKNAIPEYNLSNLYNLGHNVMRDHMMAHINYVDETEYIKLLDLIIFNTFYYKNDESFLYELKNILDEFFEQLESYFLKIFYEFNPDVLGISVLRDTIAPSLYIFKLIKEKNPNIMTVMGGSIFSDHLIKDTPNFKNFIDKTPFIDNILIGKGEGLFLKLLNGELPNDRKVFTLNDICEKELNESLENFPDMSNFNVRQNYTYLAAQGSSSCPFQCSFCNVATFYGKYTKKPVDQTVDEMVELYEKYGHQMFFMNDALLNPIIDDLAKEFISRNVSLYYDGYLRVDDESGKIENTLKWRKGGFYRARIGIESGSQNVLDLMGKNITVEQSKRTLSALAKAGIKTTAYIVIGHPGETEKDFQQTLDFVSEMRNYIWETECNPFIFAYTGQADSVKWVKQRKLLYPAEAKDMLMMESWTINCEPSRKETYDRVSRFVEHCKNIGIPNPYSLYEIQFADERWMKLHKNAVPSLIDFQNRNDIISENKEFKEICSLKSTLLDEGDFSF
ncbi:MAG: radical SAM protein [Bacteroidales bacterium]|nr:radical SAM protein [Bacteroidales bacterium]